MNIRLASFADENAWESYVTLQAKAQIAHQFAWYRFIEAVFHLEPCYWLAEENQQIVGIAPFFLRNHFGLGKRLTSMPYLNTGGIVADSERVRDALWQHISLWAAENGVSSIELRSRDVACALPQFPVRSGRIVSVIPLLSTEDAAWQTLRKNARTRVRKAEKEGLKIQVGFEHFTGFWDAYVENMHLLGAPVLPRHWFLKLAETPQLKATLLTALHKDEIVAGMVLLGFKDGLENLWAASTLAGRELCSNDYIYWEAMRWAISQGCTWLDLGRSQVESGHEKFKEKFGAVAAPLPYQEIQHEGGQWAAVTDEPARLYHAFMATWKRLPRPLVTRIGPYFSRQLY